MYLLMTFGILLWFVYGLLISSWPVIIANLVAAKLASMMLAMKLKYG